MRYVSMRDHDRAMMAASAVIAALLGLLVTALAFNGALKEEVRQLRAERGAACSTR